MVDLENGRREYVRLLEESLKRVIEKLGDRVERISVFGSYARGRRDLLTDLDILVVMETDKPFLDRLEEIYSTLALPVDARSRREEGGSSKRWRI